MGHNPEILRMRFATEPLQQGMGILMPRILRCLLLTFAPMQARLTWAVCICTTTTYSMINFEQLVLPPNEEDITCLHEPAFLLSPKPVSYMSNRFRGTSEADGTHFQGCCSPNSVQPEASQCHSCTMNLPSMACFPPDFIQPTVTNERSSHQVSPDNSGLLPPG
jgi:hypothetical protein